MFGRTAGFAVLALALLPLAACDSGTSANMGSLQILLTDAPGDFVQAVVTIDHIYLQPDSSEPHTGSGLDRQDLMTTPTTQNLLSLANDVTTLVDGAPVPEGSYAQLRFVVSDACIEVENNDSTTTIYATRSDYTECGTPAATLQTPSFDQTGIKVQMPDGALTVTGSQQILLVDFDVSQSFGHDAGTGMWAMQPVIRATNVELTGGVDVNLSLGQDVQLPVINNAQVTLGDFQATLSGEAVPAAFTDPDGDGVFTAHFLYLDPSAGPFEAGIRGPDGLTFTLAPADSQSVSLSSGDTSAVDFTVTGATAQ
jgi:hypothetical protein